jgi:hypothetical protein
MSQPQTIHARILDSFNDEELRIFCSEHYPAVGQEYTVGMTRGHMVYLLIEYCRRRKQVDKLLDYLELERPGLIGKDRSELLAGLAFQPTREMGVFTEAMAKRAREIAREIQDLRGILAGGSEFTPNQLLRYQDYNKQLDNLLKDAPPEFLAKLYEHW